MYYKSAVPLPTPIPFPSITHPKLTVTYPSLYSNTGCDDEVLILPQSLPIMASFLLQVFVYAPRIQLHLCWSIICANFNQERQDMVQKISKISLDHSLYSKSIVFPAPNFEDFNVIAFPAPHHVTLSCLSPPEKYTHTFNTDITAFPITIHYPSHLQDMEPRNIRRKKIYKSYYKINLYMKMMMTISSYQMKTSLLIQTHSPHING